MLQIRFTIILLFLTATLYAQTDSTYSYLFRHYPYDSLSEAQIEKLEEIKKPNTGDLLSQRFVKLKEYLLENGAFYLNFSEDSVVFVTGEFESFGDWNYYYWVGKADIPASIGMFPVAFRTYGWDFTFTYKWRYITPDSSFDKSYTLRYLGDSMYFLGEYHHKSELNLECGSPYAYLPLRLMMMENKVEEMKPWRMLGLDVKFCAETDMDVKYMISDMAGRTYPLINKFFTAGSHTITIPEFRLSRGVYVFWLIITSNGEIIYKKSMKVRKME